jgi:hypothetical protein
MTKTNSKRRKRSTARKSSRSGMGRWYLAAAVIVGGIVAYEHRGEFGHLPGASKLTALLSHAEKPAEKRAQAKKPAEKKPPKKVELATIPIPFRPKEQTGSIAPKTALIPPAPVELPVRQSLEQASRPRAAPFIFAASATITAFSTAIPSCTRARGFSSPI